MKIDDKLELLARAIRGEVKIEKYFTNRFRWFQIEYDSENCFISKCGLRWSVDALLYLEIREVKKLPLLTKDECEFLKWFPQELVITYHAENGLVYLSDRVNNTEEFYFNFNTFPKFREIENDKSGGYTIGELIAYAKENMNESK